MIEFDPAKNENVIALVRQEDGNYIGYCKKFGKLISVRDVGPEIVLQLLLTHNGNS